MVRNLDGSQKFRNVDQRFHEISGEKHGRPEISPLHQRFRQARSGISQNIRYEKQKFQEDPVMIRDFVRTRVVEVMNSQVVLTSFLL